MIVLIADKMSEFFIVKNVIKREDKGVYQYGSELLISELMSTVVSLIIAICFGRVLETICYLIVFETIRVYSGGYHASSHRNCIITFNLIYIGILFLVEMIGVAQLSSWMFLGMLVGSVIIFVMAPVQDQNKPLSNEEVSKYRVSTRKRILFYGVLSSLLYFLTPRFTSVIFIHIAIFQISILLIIGYYKNIKLKKRMDRTILEDTMI